MWAQHIFGSLFFIQRAHCLLGKLVTYALTAIAPRLQARDRSGELRQLCGAGMAVICVLGIMALLHYAQAQVFAVSAADQSAIILDLCKQPRDRAAIGDPICE